ncbi:hypothetical protein [Tenacibaculum discolor]|uniref:hypothetical protein n=1 Tax=Tenacibaculum discolor TaxID=361581 RepID=UPI000EB09857|nr:hypothetical protein [Tenacibaculum discolor]RLK02361.1 hypothetical protein C8N27_1496 [Tenacibaculum discolor]
MAKYPLTKEQYEMAKKMFQGQGASYGKKKGSGIRVVTAYGSKQGLFMAGWKVSKGVKWNIKVFRDKYQKEVAPTTSKTGKEWCSVRVVLKAPMHDSVSIQGMINLNNSKVYIEDWNWILNPNAPNGGYVGKRFSKK